MRGFRDYAIDITIHNDVADWSGRHGFSLILMQNTISNSHMHVALNTDIGGRGKGLLFSRWGTGDLAYPMHSQTDGWTDSSGGEFIGVRRLYSWGPGDYRVRIAPDGLESDGEWFSLWITDLSTNETTWIGSLKFPLLDGTTTMQPRSSATIELQGSNPIRPTDVPQWHVSFDRPSGDNVFAERGFTTYPFDDHENALPNSNVSYDQSEDRAHLIVGGATERRNPAENSTFTALPDHEPISLPGRDPDIPTPTPTQSPTPTPAPTATPTPTPSVDHLYIDASVPEHMAYVWWHWSRQQGYREIVMDLSIHNDLHRRSSENHGIYIMAGYSAISEVGFYFGLQTAVTDPRTGRSRGKGLIFSRWNTRDLDNARVAEGGWTQSSGHEGDFIGVRRLYDWKKGDYRLRLAPGSQDSDGEWFGLWITDLETEATTWIGSLRFPYDEHGEAWINGRLYSTIEIYGTGTIRPVDIPEIAVTVSGPLVDGSPPFVGMSGLFVL